MEIDIADRFLWQSSRVSSKGDMDAVYVDNNKCDGCKASKNPPCVRLCPGDLLYKDFTTNKAVLRDKAECWDCYACVKPCPQDALEIKLSYQIGFFNASCARRYFGRQDWLVTVDTKGNVERFGITKYVPVPVEEPESKNL
jgi:adenylylsulfate reductase subunit B